MQNVTVADRVRRPFQFDHAHLDYRKLLGILHRRAYLLLAAALIGFVPIIIYIFTATPLYTATSSVMIDVRKENVVDVNAVLSGLPADSTVVDSEVRVLESRSLAGRVVDALHLDRDPEFNSRLRSHPVSDFIQSVFHHRSSDAAGANDAAMRRDVVDAVLKRLDAHRSGTTYVLEISFRSASPVKAARIANSFADQYLVAQLNDKFEATRQANNWLSDRVRELRGQVQQAEAAVQRFKIDNNLMSAEGATLTEQEISGLNAQLATAQANQAEQEARLSIARSQLARGSTGDDVGETLNSPVIQELRAQRAAQSAKVADLETRYDDRHPELIKEKRRLADIDQQIQQEIKRIISSLDAATRVARQRTASIADSVSRSRGTLAKTNRAGVQLNELERNADAVRTLYESFLNRFKQTSSQAGVAQTDARILSRAEVPASPSYPPKDLGIALALLFGLATGLSAVVIAELLERGLSSSEDVERELGVSYLGGIPELSSTVDEGGDRTSNPADYVVAHPLSSFAESFRTLRTATVYSRAGEKVKTIAVTSSVPGEGKTTTAICLARVMAISGASVVVVDCDVRQRGINSTLGLDPEQGLLEVLNGTASLERVMVHDEATGAMVLPFARAAYTPRDIFGTVAMKQLLAELERRFEYVVLDLPPMLPIADARVVAPMADAVVMLVRWRKTDRKAAQNSLSLLADANAHIAGVAVSQMDVRKQAREGYGDPGYYYKAYRSYYHD